MVDENLPQLRLGDLYVAGLRVRQCRPGPQLARFEQFRRDDRNQYERLLAAQRAYAPLGGRALPPGLGAPTRGELDRVVRGVGARERAEPPLHG
ncbi:hypothetical protein [Streptomyces antarcticus]|uniref:hypothetical protein n=1 Tax=Streptomyces antarcticus TaxID=2996458 RepID=UPI0022710D50|nr:hypothetical protein [Streptomyces sp. H34-AA3]MCZ4082174.1 hypothetical protein [Streptomyces sp. H34-S5]